MARPWYRLRKHRTARSLVREHLYDELQRDDECDISIPAHPLSPEDGAFTYDEFLESIKEHGMWAFARVYASKKIVPEIHYWVDHDVPDDDLAEMLGHELGHISGRRLRGERDEEERADSYGKVGREVLRIIRRRRK